MSHARAREFLRSMVWIYEKLDGINIAVWLGPDDVLCFGFREGLQSLLPGHVIDAICIYCLQREELFRRALAECAVVYGEWMRQTLSIRYDRLSDWFVLLATQSRGGRLQLGPEAARFAASYGFESPPLLARARLRHAEDAAQFVASSAFGAKRMEGVVLVRGGGRIRAAKWIDHRFAAASVWSLGFKRNRLQQVASQNMPRPVLPKRLMGARVRGAT